MRPARVLPALVVLALTGACGKKTDAEPSLASSAPVTSATAAAIDPAPSGSADAAEIAAALSPSSTSVVDLGGHVNLPPPLPEGTGKLAARAMLVPVYERPTSASKKVGYLRAGAIVDADPTDVGHEDCPGGWRAIKPVGYVCVGDKATLDLSDPIVKASFRRPDVSQKLPYMYGTVTRGGPVYSRVPTEAELKEYEPGLKKHISKWKSDEVSGASYGLELWYKWKDKPSFTALEALDQRLTDDDIPFYLKDGALLPNLSGQVKGTDVKIGQVDRKQGAAFVDSFLVDGRRYNVTTDLRLVPADRYRPIKGSERHGVEIGKDVEIPFAIVRKPGAKKWIFSKDKAKEDGDIDTWTAVNLTGKQKFSGGVLHFETKDGYWLDDRHASRIDAAKKMPKWGTNGERWIDVNITKQVLVAYDGTKPVYATLVSTGEDGLSEGGHKQTVKGIFRVHTKFITTTMDSDAVGEEFELRDVPYVQYFEEGFALHGAYWHDGFGTPKSHGCVNLTPEDARRLFFFTDPQVPYGWHGAVKALTGSVVFVHP